MDEETRAALATMMARINNNHEQVLQSARDTNLTLQAMGATLNTVNSMLGLIADGFSDHARRITDLEKKGP